MKNPKTSVLILESSPLFRMALTEFLLKNTGYEVIHCSAAEDHLLLSNYTSLGYLIIDVSQKIREAIAMSKSLKKAIPCLKILATDYKLQPAIARKCFYHQIDGYISKNASVEEFKQALQTLKNGEQ